MDSYAAVIGASLFAGVASFAAGAWVAARRSRTDEQPGTDHVREREKLLEAAFDSAPPAVLMKDSGRVVMTNRRARETFAEGQSFEGQNFLTLIGNAPEAFRDAMLANEDALFTVPGADGDVETFRLTKRQLSVEGEPHVFLVVEQLTRQIRRQEVDVWKKLLRTISHELNNSLAPISSMVHSARVILDKPDHLPKLTKVFDTIEDRTRHLQEFIEGYVRFARLPKPRLVPVKWTELLGRIRDLYPGVRVDAPSDARGRVDAAQFEQVLINLVKNAIEAGSPSEEVVVSVKARDQGVDVVVSDRGPGMSTDVLANALLPFYSTKEKGTGLGLALSREILEAHGGKIRVENREGGGLSVTCSLRQETEPDTARLTLTRA